MVMSFASQMKGLKFAPRNLSRSEAGRLLSIGTSDANVIRALISTCLQGSFLDASNHCIHVGQLLAEGRRRSPPGSPVSSANKTRRHDMT